MWEIHYNGFEPLLHILIKLRLVEVMLIAVISAYLKLLLFEINFDDY